MGFALAFPLPFLFAGRALAAICSVFSLEEEALREPGLDDAFDELLDLEGAGVFR